MTDDTITIVKIKNPEIYGCERYGILQQKMEETSIINFDSNMGGLCVNIKNEDFYNISSYMWSVIRGRVIIHCNDGTNYLTNLRLWE